MSTRNVGRSRIAEASFRARLAELGAELLEPYQGSKHPHRVRCAAGHECSPMPHTIQRGRGICRICARTSPEAAEASFRARLAELGAELLEPYQGSEHPHRARCAAGHECNAWPAAIRAGKGICRICAGQSPIVAEAMFRARLAELGAELLEPVWLGAMRPHHVRCAAGHECNPRPAAVASGHGICRACAGLSPAVAEASFRARLAELGAELLEPYRDSARPHRVRCAAGHECRPRPRDTGQGVGICQACAGREWDVFYVVTTADRMRLKFGITAGDGQRRLAVHRRYGYSSVARLMLGLPASAAAEIESAALAALRLAKIKPVRGREYFDGTALAVVLDIADNYPMVAVPS